MTRRTSWRDRMGRAVPVLVAVLAVAVSGCATSPPARSSPPGRRPAGAGSAVVEHPGSGSRRFWARRSLIGAAAVTHWPAFRFPKTAHPVAAPPRAVGALLYHDGAGDHFCTASVLDSPQRDIVVTAAHCVHTGAGGHYRQDIVFAPGYQQGRTPYGIWRPTAIIVDQRWITSSDPDLDVAFLILAPQNGKDIGDVLSGNQLVTGRPDPLRVRVTGYPNSSGSPITCTGQAVSESPTQQRFACGGYATGTSGSPWITSYDRQTHTGELVGVIGGYQQGGDTPDISYSPLFGPAVARLYDKALAAAGG